MVCGGSLSHLSQLTGMLEQKRALIQTEFLKEKKKRPFSDKGVGAKYAFTVSEKHTYIPEQR